MFVEQWSGDFVSCRPTVRWYQMRIRIQGEARVRVTEHLLQDLDVHPDGQRTTCERVS